MSSRHPPLLILPLALAGCTTTTVGDAPVATRHAPVHAPTGIDRIMGHEARALTALFGTPALDLREGTARKLQFRGVACVLDAYLYPPAGGGEPRVTWLDARDARGGEFDRASCIAALARR